MTENNVIDMRPREVRIYLCSSYTDMVVEKQTLQLNVFRQLRNRFHEEGVEFQVIDLRHGAALDPGRYFLGDNTHLREITRTRQRSAAINFIALLGHKYEPCLVPREITKDAFRILLSHLDEEERDYLMTYYHRDNNSIPPSYVLSPDRKVLDTLSTEEAWSGFETARLYLKKALNVAHDKRQFPSKWAGNILESNLFREVERGLRGNSKHAMVIKRTCYNTDTLSSPTLHRFFDMVEEGDIIIRNEEYKQLVQNFRNKLLPKLKPDKKIHNFSPEALPVSALSKCEEQVKYLDDLVETVEKEVSPASLMSKILATADDEVCEDNDVPQSLRDAELSIEYTELIESVRQKLPRSRRPFVVSGPRGCGKTELMEHLYKRSRDVFKVDPSQVIWRSFCPQVEDGCLVDLITGLIISIMEVQNIEDDIPCNHDAFLLSERLRKLLSKSYLRPVVIMMDGVENIPTTHNSHCLRWLPSLLGTNVHLLLSISSETDLEDPVLENARLWVGDSSRIFTVPAFSQVSASELILQQLAVTSRSLRPDQFDGIFRAFHQSSNPLLLRMAIRESRSWRSFTTQDEMVVKTSITEALRLLCRRCEDASKEVVVRTSLGSICASRHGLSEAEIKDLLTLDDRVIATLWKQGSYPAQKSAYPFKAPDMYWHRIVDIMEPYLLETPRQGRFLISWRHQIVHDVIKERYVGEKEDDFHFSLADYFSGKWSDRFKQISIEGVPYNVDCMVPPMPWILSNGAANLRKVAEYPYHLTRCGKSEELVRLLLDGAWLMQLAQMVGLCPIIEMMSLFREARHLAVFSGVVKELKAVLKYSTTAHHILSSLLSKFGYHTSQNGNNGMGKDSPGPGLLLMDSAKQLDAYKEAAFVPIKANFQNSKSFHGSLTEVNGGHICVLSKNGAIFALAQGNLVRVYNLSGETTTWYPIKEYKMPRDNESILNVQMDDAGTLLCVITTVAGGAADKNISRLYEIKYHHCSYTEDNIVLATLDKTGKWLVIGQMNGGMIVGTDDKKRRATLCFPEQCGRLEKLVTTPDGHIVAQFQVGKLVVYGSNGKLQTSHRIFYHGYGGESMQTVESVGITWQWGITKGYLVWYTAPQGYQLNLVSLNDDILKTHKFLDKRINGLFCDENSDRFVLSCVGENKNYVQIWDASLNKTSHTIEDLSIQNMTFLKSRNLLVVTNSLMEVWSFDKGHSMCSMSLYQREDDNKCSFLEVTSADDNQLAVVDSGLSIDVFNVTSTLNTAIKSWTKKEDVGTYATCLAISELSFCAIVATSSGQLRQVDLVSGDERRHVKGHQDQVLAIACSDPILASSSVGEVCLWGLPELEAISQFTRKGLLISQLGFTNEAKLLVCLTRKEIITLDIETMTPKVQTATTFGPYGLLKCSPHWSAVVGADIQPGAGYVSFYHTHTAKLARSPSPPGDAIQCVAFSPSSKYAVIAFSCSPTENPTSNCIRIYDTQSLDTNFGRYLEGRSMQSPSKYMILTSSTLLCCDDCNMVTVFRNNKAKLELLTSFKQEGPSLAMLLPSELEMIVMISKHGRQTKYNIVCGRTGKVVYAESLPLRQPILDVMVTSDARYSVFLQKDGMFPMAGIIKQNLELHQLTIGDERRVKSRACTIL